MIDSAKLKEDSQINRRLGDDLQSKAPTNMFFGSESGKYASKGQLGGGDSVYSGSNLNRRRPNVPVSMQLGADNSKVSQNTRLRARLDRLGSSGNSSSSSNLQKDDPDERQAVLQQSSRADSLLQGVMSDMDQIFQRNQIYSVSDYYKESSKDNVAMTSSKDVKDSSMYHQPQKRNLGGMSAVLSGEGGGHSGSSDIDWTGGSSNMVSTGMNTSADQDIPTYVPKPPNTQPNTTRRRPGSSRNNSSNGSSKTYNILQDLTKLEQKIQNDEEDVFVDAVSTSTQHKPSGVGVDYFNLLTDKVDVADYVFKKSTSDNKTSISKNTSPCKPGSNGNEDLVTSMAQRLHVLEKLVKQQASKLDESNHIAFSHSQKETRMQRVVALQQRQIQEMERFLSDYDMTWAGYSVQNELGSVSDYIDTGEKRLKEVFNSNNHTGNTITLERPTGSTTATAAASSHLLTAMTPAILKQWISIVNERVPSNAVLAVDKKASLVKPQVAVTLFANGLALDRLFLISHSDTWTRALRDLSEGFIPDVLSAKYPEGVSLKLNDKSSETVTMATHGVNADEENKEDQVFELKRSAVAETVGIKVVDGNIVRGVSAVSSSNSNNSGNHNNIHRLPTDASTATTTTTNNNNNNNNNSTTAHILAFSSIGRELESSKPVLPSIDASKLATNAAAMQLLQKVSSQMDDNVRKVLGLPNKHASSVTRTIVSDGDVVSVLKRTGEPTVNTNIAERSVQLQNNPITSTDHQNIPLKDIAVTISTNPVSTVEPKKTTNVAQSRLLTVKSTATSNTNIATNNSNIAYPITTNSTDTNSMFQYSSIGGIGKPQSIKDIESLHNTQKTVVVFDCSTTGTYNVELDAIHRVNNDSTDKASYVKITYTDQPLGKHDNYTPSVFLRIERAASIGELLHAIKSHRRSQGYEPGVLNVRRPNESMLLSQTGTIQSNSLVGQQLVVRRKQ